LRQGSGRRVTEVEKGKPERKEKGTGIGEKRRGERDQEREGERYMETWEEKKGKERGQGSIYRSKNHIVSSSLKEDIFSPAPQKYAKIYSSPTLFGFIFALSHLFCPINFNGVLKWGSMLLFFVSTLSLYAVALIACRHLISPIPPPLFALALLAQHPFTIYIFADCPVWAVDGNRISILFHCPIHPNPTTA
jgi:hypothetical protein